MHARHVRLIGATSILSEGPSIKDVGIFFGGGGGLKFLYCKKKFSKSGLNCDMEEGVVKTAKKIPTSFMDAP